MDNKTKMLLLVGAGVGAYLLYQKQASANPFTWLPVVHPAQSTGPAGSSAPIIATGLSAGVSLFPTLVAGASSVGNTLANWFGGLSTTTPTVADLSSLSGAGSGVYADPSLAGGYTVTPLNFNYIDQPAGYGVLTPDFALDPAQGDPAVYDLFGDWSI